MTTTTGRKPEWAPELVGLYKAHHRDLISFAKRRVNAATAEDLVNDAFLHYHQRQCRPMPGKELSYIRSMVVHAGSSAARREIRGRELIDRQARRLGQQGWPRTRNSVDSPEEEVILTEDVQKVRAAIAKLPERQRQVLVLRYQMGLSESEIAERLGISRGSVKTHASRARSTLASLLDVLED